MCTSWNELASCGRHCVIRGVRFDPCDIKQRPNAAPCRKLEIRSFKGTKICHCKDGYFQERSASTGVIKTIPLPTLVRDQGRGLSSGQRDSGKFLELSSRKSSSVDGRSLKEGPLKRLVRGHKA